METKNNLSRMTVDIPLEAHRKLKALSAILGKSMRDVVIESIQAHIHNLSSCPINNDIIKKIGI